MAVVSLVHNLEWSGGLTMFTFEPIKAELKLSAKRAASLVAYRAWVPGGWIVLPMHPMGLAGSGSTVFLPDPSHQWDGSSLPAPAAKHVCDRGERRGTL